jgi:hypothetical protein
MTRQGIGGMRQAGIVQTARRSVETAVTAAAPNFASARSGRILLGTLTVRVPHHATEQHLTEAVSRAIRERLR